LWGEGKRKGARGRTEEMEGWAVDEKSGKSKEQIERK